MTSPKAARAMAAGVAVALGTVAILAQTPGSPGIRSKWKWLS